jgi:transketolase C-terminal domain/subunit
VGIPDTFAESGEYKLLLEKYGLGVENIKQAVKEVLKRKLALGGGS